jgi:hypothetical protein
MMKKIMDGTEFDSLDSDGDGSDVVTGDDSD